MKPIRIKSIFKKKIYITLAFLIVLYNSLFNKFTAQKLLDSTLPGSINGEISFKVESFSLFFGITINDILIKSQDSGSEFLSIKKINLNYNLPLLLIGRVKISEIGIYNSKIYISKVNNSFNFEKIFKNSEKSLEEKVDKNEEKLENINIYLYLSMYLNVIIDSMEIVYEDEINKLKINDINFLFNFDTYRVNEIPLEISFLDIFENLYLEFQPSKNLNITFKNNDISMNQNYNLYFFLEKNSENNLLKNNIIIKSDNFSPIYRNKSIDPIDFGIEVNANLIQKKFILDKINIYFKEKQFLHLSGFIDQIDSKESDIELNLKDSSIDLSLLGSYLKNFENTFPSVSGNLNLSPLKVQGKLNSLNLNWNIKGENIKISSKKEYNFSELILNIYGKFNLFQENKPKFSLKSLEKLEMSESKVIFNNSKIDMSLKYFQEKISGFLNIENLNLGYFNNIIIGTTNLNLMIIESNFSAINLKLKSKIENFQIPIQNGNLKPSRMSINGNFNLSLNKNFSFHSIHAGDAEFELLNYNQGKAVNLNLKNFQFSNSSNSVSYENLNSVLILDKLRNIVPFGLSENLKSLASLSGNQFEMNSSFYYELSGKKNLNLKLNTALEGLNLNDLTAIVKLQLNYDNNQSINIENLQIGGYNQRLSINLNGKLMNTTQEKKTIQIPNLNGVVTYHSKQEFPLNKNLKIQGLLELGFSISGNIVKGDFKSNSISITYSNSDCPGIKCKTYQVSNINFQIPIEHEIKNIQSESILDGNKSIFIKSISSSKDLNFKIESISGTHPTIQDKNIIYTKGSPDNPSIKARIEYQDNRLSIFNLLIHTLNGNLHSKNIIFNLRDLKPENIEYLGNMQVRDIDLKELLSEDSKKNIDDGKIKGDINFSGKDLSDIIGNTDIYLSIFKIGSDFGKSAINVVSPPNLIRDYIVSNYSVDKIELELSKGLVYISILFKQGILTNLLTKIDNNKISQERMPLNNFLNRAKDEFSNY